MYYGVRDRVIYTEDLSECNFQTVASDPRGKSFGKKLGDIAFHPDGRIYAINDSLISSINVHNGESEIVTPLADQNIDIRFGTLLISEEGDVLIAGQKKQILSGWFFDLRELSVLGTIDLNWILESSNIIGNGSLYSELNKKYIGGVSNQELILYNINKQTTELLEWNNTPEQAIFGAAKSLPPCGEAVLLGFNPVIGVASYYAGLNVETGEFTQYCNVVETNTLAYATPTDFRRSTLRIDLDKDNSSGHITAGYYDTLTTCHKEVPVMDDMELYTCGQEVDYISFRLRYYDTPRLPEERIYSDGFADPVLTSPGRYVWQNTYGADKEKIKEYLQSLRYRADWNPDDPEESRERVVITTMHVGEDSTSSWTVFQLEKDEVYAGRDTLVEYCRSSTSVDLHSFLSSDALAGGRFDPELSGGEGLFIPGTDPSGEYRYIVESAGGGCIDTAVLNVQELDVSGIGLDTVYTCPGARIRIGFPPGKFSDVQWWDGSSGDSIWVQKTTDVMRQVNVTYGSCGLNVTVHILMQEPGQLAGPDTTFYYCPADPPIDLSTMLPAPQGSSVTLESVLQSGSLVFTPGTDPPDTYEYVVNAGGCADSALITLQEAATQRLPFDDVRLCADEDVRIGLPSGDYDNISWWNGGSGDSTILTNADRGPFWVEAHRGGCIYRADFGVTIQNQVEFPGTYPDTLTLCSGDQTVITVQELDSVELAGNTYLPGEQIVFSDPGDILLSGFQNGCSTSKMIDVTIVPEPSGSYDKTIYWCEGTPLTLSLPNDSAGLQFNWSDGGAPKDRPINTPGKYGFDIRSGTCTFQSSYTVIRNGDSECEDAEECTVSIPNAVTPNGDGWNDELTIVLSPQCGELESVTLYNKWGGLLYQSSSPMLGSGVWNGLTPGVYIVQVVYRDGAGRRRVEAGSVLVIS